MQYKAINRKGKLDNGKLQEASSMIEHVRQIRAAEHGSRD